MRDFVIVKMASPFLRDLRGFAHPPLALRRSRAADARGKKSFGFQSVSAHMSLKPE
jgi:hypothetical protein